MCHTAQLAAVKRMDSNGDMLWNIKACSPSTFRRSVLPLSSTSRSKPLKGFVSYLVYYSALKIEAPLSSETSLDFARLHGVTLHKIVLSVVAAVGTSAPEQVTTFTRFVLLLDTRFSFALPRF
jgi:hypothetical protein